MLSCRSCIYIAKTHLINNTEYSCCMRITPFNNEKDNASLMTIDGNKSTALIIHNIDEFGCMLHSLVN